VASLYNVLIQPDVLVDNNNHPQTFLSSIEQAIGMNLFRKSTLQFASGVMVDVVAFSLQGSSENNGGG
jgi:hypothetical protein